LRHPKEHEISVILHY